MAKLHIITDSCAYVPGMAQFHAAEVTVIPRRFSIGGKTYLEGVDLALDEVVRTAGSKLSVQPPEMAEYVEIYRRLTQRYDGLISIHASRELLPIWQTARQAAQQFAGHCKIIVIDSQTLSAGQLLLIRLALSAIHSGAGFEEVVRVVRGAVERLYSVFYIESADPRALNAVLSPSHAILSGMLGVKPLLTIEHGQVIPIEKVRTRVQAVERLVEYAVEFTAIADALIVQARPFATETTRMLQERLALEFPDREFPLAEYGPSLTMLIGAEATGLVVLEDEFETEVDGIDDDN